jgi:aryl-alcohol dehydrogenase-like predicted oxidoreductase
VRYKLLGSSGLRVSELCLGTMSFGEAWGFGADRAESARIVTAFGERGGTFIDTAINYQDGQSEEIVGDLLAGDRDRWVIATKYSLSTEPSDPNASGNSRKNMMRSIEASLRRLRTDYVDLYYVHAWDFTTSPEEVMRGLDDLVSSGRVLHVGISDAPAWVVARANAIAELRGWSRFVGVQLRYNLLDRTAERELLPMAEAHDLAVTAWAPLAAGILTGKYSRGGDPDTLRRARLTEADLAVARAVDAVADEVGATSAQVALAWLRSRSERIVPVVGARTLGQARDLLGSLDVHVPDEALARLEEVSRIELGFPHDLLGSPTTERLLFGQTNERLVRPKPPRG